MHTSNNKRREPVLLKLELEVKRRARHFVRLTAAINFTAATTLRLLFESRYLLESFIVSMDSSLTKTDESQTKPRAAVKGGYDVSLFKVALGLVSKSHAKLYEAQLRRYNFRSPHCPLR
jgi:hypothetical protein